MSDEPALGAQMIRALKKYEEENGHLLALIDRMLDAGIEHWHTNVNADDVRELHRWLGLTEEEYSAWVEGGANGLSLHLMQDTHTVRIASPNCPTCGQSGEVTLYGPNFHEHTCRNHHVWRIY